MAISSIKRPRRLPSSPRTDMREALPTPPVLRMVTPAVRANTSLIDDAVPSNSFEVITETGIELSRNWRASFRAVTVTSSK